MCFSRARAAGWGARGERGLRGGSCRAAGGAFRARRRQGSPWPPRHGGQMVSAPRGLEAPRGGLGPAVVTVVGCGEEMSLPRGRACVEVSVCLRPAVRLGGLLRALSGVGWVVWAPWEGFWHRWPPEKALEERCGDLLRGKLQGQLGRWKWQHRGTRRAGAGGGRAWAWLVIVAVLFPLPRFPEEEETLGGFG